MSRSHESVVVVGVGARTAVGKSAPPTAAAVRAGIVRISEHPFLFDRAGQAFHVARAAYLEIDLTGAARLGELAGPAAAEALGPLRATRWRDVSVPVFIGLSLERPGRPRETASAVIGRVRADMKGAGVRSGPIEVIETGHSAGAMALQAGWEAIRSSGAELALVGGVDSYLEPETMTWLEASGQVHGASDNPWGFTPGEAAAFALLAGTESVLRFGWRSTLEVLAAATTQETKLIKTGAVCLGEGLTDLFRTLRAELPHDARADHLVCDMNGEPYRSDEFGFAVLRAGTMFRNPSAFATPASYWGDVGAAGGPLFVVLADAAVKRGYGATSVTAAFTSAESGERCGFVVQARGADRLQARS